jgi:CO/xanthine dehydrogenase FAD-binding subunit
MLNLNTIHRPTTIEDAVQLLQQPGTIPLAGGTQLVAKQRSDVSAVVDLSALELSYIRERDGEIAIGATTTLAALDESPVLRALAQGLIAEAAHHSASSILRNQGSVTGTLIGEPDGVLAVALIALDARATLAGKAPRVIPIIELWKELHGLENQLVVELTVPMSNPRASLQTVARTLSDKAIVSVAAAARMTNGKASVARIALGGVGEFVVRANAVEKALEGQLLDDATIEKAVAQLDQANLQPRGDFRGSIEYRIEMAHVLTRRALKEIQKP